MPHVSGSCVCGAVRYSSSAEPVATVFCHCRDCQKFSGSGYSANVAVPDDSLSLEGPLKSYRAPGGSGKALTRSFCPECGSQIAIRAESFAGVTLIQAGSMDDASWVEPGLHIWCSSAQPWDRLPEGANCLPGSPPAPS